MLIYILLSWSLLLFGCWVGLAGSRRIGPSWRPPAAASPCTGRAKCMARLYRLHPLHPFASVACSTCGPWHHGFYDLRNLFIPKQTCWGDSIPDMSKQHRYRIQFHTVETMLEIRVLVSFVSVYMTFSRGFPVCKVDLCNIHPWRFWEAYLDISGPSNCKSEAGSVWLPPMCPRLQKPFARTESPKVCEISVTWQSPVWSSGICFAIALDWVFAAQNAVELHCSYMSDCDSTRKNSG